MWWKKIIQIFAGIVLGLVILVGGLIGYFYFHQSQIVKLIVDEVNKRVNTTVDVSNISLSLWERFPSVAVKFENVVVYNAVDFKTQANDTLLRAGYVFADLDLNSLFSGTPQIDAISVSDGILYVAIDKSGVSNYNVFKSSQNKPSTDQASVNFNKVELNHITIDYNDYREMGFYRAYFPEIRLAGIIGSKGFAVKTYISMSSNNFVPSMGGILKTIQYEGSVSYLEKKLIDWNGIGKFDNSVVYLKGFYNIENGQLLVETDNIGVDNNQINSIIRYFNIDSSPLLNASFRLSNFRYLQSSAQSYQITTGFKLRSGLQYDERSFEVMAVGRANYNGKSLFAKIENFDVRTNESHGHFEGSIEWPKNKISGHVSINSTLKDFIAIAKTDEFEKPVGTVDAQANVNGTFGNNVDYFSLISDGEIGLNNVGFNYRNYEIENLSGVVDFKDASSCLPKFTVQINGNQLEYEGRVHNFSGFYTNKETITINGKLTSPDLNLDDLLTNDNPEQNPGIAIPTNLNIHLYAEVAQFQKKPFVGKKINLELKTTGKRFDLSKLSLNMADGDVSLVGRMIQQQNNEWYTSISAEITKVDVSKTFTIFNNFGQNELVDNNLSGLLTANVDADFVLSPNFSVKIPTIFLESDITILNGGIINYKTLEALSDFIAVEELEHVKFSELNNRIKISDNTLYIPYMNIESSAINLGIEGTHKFNNEIEYIVSVGLSDVLFSKFKRKHKEVNPLRRNKKMVVAIDISGSTENYNISLAKIQRVPAEAPDEQPKAKKKFEIQFDDMK